MQVDLPNPMHKKLNICLLNYVCYSHFIPASHLNGCQKSSASLVMTSRSTCQSYLKWLTHSNLKLNVFKKIESRHTSPSCIFITYIFSSNKFYYNTKTCTKKGTKWSLLQGIPHPPTRQWYHVDDQWT